jgi:hypothetical protein
MRTCVYEEIQAVKEEKDTQADELPTIQPRSSRTLGEKRKMMSLYLTHNVGCQGEFGSAPNIFLTYRVGASGKNLQ